MRPSQTKSLSGSPSEACGRGRLIFRCALGVVALQSATSNCGYDFDAPFRGPFASLDAASDSADASKEAGSGGKSGKGGSAGKAGSAGKGGSAGSSGASGSGGSAGLAGSAGLGGIAGSAASGGIAGTGGSGGADENCTNSKDDNGNGLIDCADPACTAGFVCIPALGDYDSVGFRRIYPAQENPVACSDGEEPVTWFSSLVQVSPGECSCVCSTPLQPTCKSNSSCYESKSCSSGTAIPIGVCVDCSDGNYYEGLVEGEAAGGCDPSTTSKFDPPTWGSAVDYCRIKSGGGGCGASEICVPKPTAAFDSQPCVERSGSLNCPANLPHKTLAYESYADTRDCLGSSCQCGPPAVQCTATLTGYSDLNCSAAAYPLLLSGICQPLLSSIDSVFLEADIVLSSCQPGGMALVTGNVQPLSPHTLCCK